MKNWKLHLSLCLIVLLSACAPAAAPVHTLPSALSTSTTAPAVVPTSNPTTVRPTTPPPAATNVPTLNAALPTSTASQAGKPVEVAMANFEFKPSTLRVKIGTTVTWTNMDPDDHIVTGQDGKWSSKVLGQGQTFSFTFTQAGTFSYTCAFHPGMDGKVEVEP